MVWVPSHVVDLLDFDAHAHNPMHICPELKTGVKTKRRGLKVEKRGAPSHVVQNVLKATRILL